MVFDNAGSVFCLHGQLKISKSMLRIYRSCSKPRVKVVTSDRNIYAHGILSYVFNLTKCIFTFIFKWDFPFLCNIKAFSDRE